MRRRLPPWFCQGWLRRRWGPDIAPGAGDLVESGVTGMNGDQPNPARRPCSLRLKWESESLLKGGSYSAYLKWESEKKVTSSVPTPGAIIYMWLRSRERSHIIFTHSHT